MHKHLTTSLLIAGVLLGAVAAFAAETSVSQQSTAVAGTALSFADVDTVNGNSFSNAGTVVALVANDGLSTNTVTVSTNTWQGYAVADQTVTIPPSTIVAIGRFNATVFANSDGNVVLNYDGPSSTSMRLAALRIRE